MSITTNIVRPEQWFQQGGLLDAGPVRDEADDQGRGLQDTQHRGAAGAQSYRGPRGRYLIGIINLI